jgi:hypothetical protein
MRSVSCAFRLARNAGKSTCFDNAAASCRSTADRIARTVR